MGLCVSRPRRYALFLFVRVIPLCLNAEGAPPRLRLMAKEFATTRKTPLVARSTPRQIAPRTRYFLRTGVVWVIKKPGLYALFFSVRANFFTPKFCGSAAVPRAPPPKKSATSQHTTQHTATETCAEANAPQSLSLSQAVVVFLGECLRIHPCAHSRSSVVRAVCDMHVSCAKCAG